MTIRKSKWKIPGINFNLFCMILKEKYTPYNSKTIHFDYFFNLYLQDRLRDEKSFIQDLANNLDFEEIEIILEKHFYSHQTKIKKIIDFLDSSSNFQFLIDTKADLLRTHFDKLSEEHFYPSLIIYFTKQQIKYEALKKLKCNLKQTRAFYDQIIKTINQRIVLNGNLLTNYLLGLKNYDVKDALAAYMVFDQNDANIIFDKAMISNSNPLKLQFDILLSDWTICIDKDKFIPRVKFLQEFGLAEKKVFEIERVPIDVLTKRLHSFKYVDRPFTQNNLFNTNDVRNEALFINLLKDLFDSIDKKITKKEVDIFYYSLTQVNPKKFSNQEMVQTQYKINKSFIDNNLDPTNIKKANRVLFAFIYKLKEYKFIKANSLTDALDEYFIPEAQLSKYTFNKYIYDKRNGTLIYDEMKEIIDKVVPDLLLRSKRTQKTHTS